MQETYERVVVRLVLGREYPPEHVDKLTRKIISYLRPIFGKDMDIAIESVDHIPSTGVGKRRIVISNLPPRGES